MDLENCDTPNSSNYNASVELYIFLHCELLLFVIVLTDNMIAMWCTISIKNIYFSFYIWRTRFIGESISAAPWQIICISVSYFYVTKQ